MGDIIDLLSAVGEFKRRMELLANNIEQSASKKEAMEKAGISSEALQLLGNSSKMAQLEHILGSNYIEQLVEIDKDANKMSKEISSAIKALKKNTASEQQNNTPSTSFDQQKVALCYGMLDQYYQQLEPILASLHSDLGGEAFTQLMNNTKPLSERSGAIQKTLAKRDKETVVGKTSLGKQGKNLFFDELLATPMQAISRIALRLKAIADKLVEFENGRGYDQAKLTSAKTKAAEAFAGLNGQLSSANERSDQASEVARVKAAQETAREEEIRRRSQLVRSFSSRSASSTPRSMSTDPASSTPSSAVINLTGASNLLTHSDTEDTADNLQTDNLQTDNLQTDNLQKITQKNR